MKAFKLAIIGGGTSGWRAAAHASKKVKVALIEPGNLGGTCLNNGCIPTKAMLYASHLYFQSRDLARYGITATSRLNFKKLMARVNAIVKEGREHIEKAQKKNKNIVLFKAKAKFIDNNTIMAGKEKIQAEKIIIAAGSRNIVPPIAGLDKIDYLDNVSILNLKKLPKSIVMIGGGYISMEFTSFFAGLGSKVTVIERLPDILNMLDADTISIVEEYYRKRNVDLHTGFTIHEVRKEGKLKRVVFDKGRSVKAEAVLVATGRVPNTEFLNLAVAGIELEGRGIKVNEFLQTTNKNIYAIGDVTGKAMFAHAAKRETKIVLSNIFESKKTAMDFSLVPWAIFTSLPVAGIGLNEKSAKEKKISYGILKADFSNVGRARIIEEQNGQVKILFSKKDKKIIGAEIAGPNADDIIHEFVALMNAGATVSTLQKMIHIHPTLSEVMENLREI
ncbi:TPA: dihydrolipoyl dehydrogenase [Candidatus Woesearchaeota archaeon]|nr:Dihydrolipoamide dehydrogenase [archaeon GW2011_AR15]MBS3103636.1 dihydrolipoyl dehydrogenase [Candidatus Woesearchaeota archaeon]HIH41763.1 dihydrolipoyl dehydrogenase [Candidatus Woesearchaeota archaeon]